MAEDKLKIIYGKLVGSKDPEVKSTFGKYSYNDFRKQLETNVDAVEQLADYLQSERIIGSGKELYNLVYTPTASVPEKVPAKEVKPLTPLEQTRELARKGGLGVVPISGTQTLTDLTREQVEVPQEQAPEFRPFVQFKNEAELQQTSKSPVFIDYNAAKGVLAEREKMDQANPLVTAKTQLGTESVYDTEKQREAGEYANKEIADMARSQRSAAPQGLIFPFKEAEESFQNLSPEDQQAAIMGSSGAELEKKKKEESKGIGQKAMDAMGDFASGFNRTIFKTPSAIAKTISEIGAGAMNLMGINTKVEDDLLYKLADKYDKWVDDSEIARTWIGEKERTGLAANVGSGAGQILSMIAAGPGGASQSIAKNPGIWKASLGKLFNKPTMVAFSQVFNSEYENMLAKGETDKTAFKQALANALAMAPLENLPLTNLAERIGRVTNPTIAIKAVIALSQGVDEGGQEAVQQLFSNLTNNQLVELEKNLVNWTEGIPESANAGSVVGMLLGAIATIGMKRRGKAVPPTGATPPPPPSGAVPPVAAPVASVTAPVPPPVAPVPPVPPVPPVAPETAPETEYAPVTEQELEDYFMSEGQSLSPERRAGVEDDIRRIQAGEITLEDLEDENYRTIVEYEMPDQALADLNEQIAAIEAAPAEGEVVAEEGPVAPAEEEAVVETVPTEEAPVAAPVAETETKPVTAPAVSETPPLSDVESTAKVIEDGDKWYKAEKSVKDKDGNDITLTIDKNKDTNHFYIKAKDNKGNEIGSALFETDNGKVWSGNEIEVNEGNRRKGIMSAIYDFAESEGHPLEPTKSLSKEGKAFWKNRKSQSLLSKEQTPPAAPAPEVEPVGETGGALTEQERNIAKQINISENEAGTAKQSSPKRTRKSKSVTEAIEREATDVESSGNAERAQEIIDAIETAENAILTNAETDDSFEEKYGINETDFAAEYNSRGKNADFEKVYETLMGKKLETKEEQTEFAQDLLSALGREGIKLKTPLGVEGVQIQVTPIPTKPFQKKGLDAFKAVVSTDKLRPSLSGVLFEDGNMVATNGYVIINKKQDKSDAEIIAEAKEALVKNNEKTMGRKAAQELANNKYQLLEKEGLNGKIINPNTGEIIEERFPEYKNAIPENNEIKSKPQKLQDLIDLANGAELVLSNNNKDIKPIVFDVAGEFEIGLSGRIMKDLLQAMQAGGVQTVTLEIQAPNKPVVIKGDNGTFGLIMPVMVGEEIKNRSQAIPLETKPVTAPAPAAPETKPEGEGTKPAPKGPETKGGEETMPTAEFTSKQEGNASTEFDGIKKPSKIKTKSFDNKYGNGAFERMQNITQNFEDIMDNLSDKIKQDCI